MSSRARPEAPLATALVLASVAWPLIVVPLAVALALMLRGAHAACADRRGAPRTIRDLGGLA